MSYDEPKILSSQLSHFCLMGADVGHLKTLYKKKNPQRGLVILDKSNYEEKIQTLSHVFKHVGHATGQLRNFAEVPLFLDSKASRLIQMADLIAYWIFRHYQTGDQRGYNLIRPYFARYGIGPVSGLRCHVSPETEARFASSSSSPFSESNAESYGRRISSRHA